MVAALLVVSIHCNPLADFDKAAEFLLQNCLGRNAVPLFFMAAVGRIAGRVVTLNSLENDLAFLVPSFALSTIRYDEYDNGYAFLFTLPVSRRGYVLEKLVFCLLLEVAAAAVGLVLSFGCYLLQGKSGAWEAPVVLPVILGLVTVFLAVGIAAVGMALSVQISVHILEKKEF